jgi:hypothetical protein
MKWSPSTGALYDPKVVGEVTADGIALTDEEAHALAEAVAAGAVLTMGESGPVAVYGEAPVDLGDPRARLADIRWRRETGGVTLPNGAAISTTREAQSQITAAVTSLQTGMIDAPVDWKTESGWASLDSDTVMMVGAAVGRHVQRCFRAERIVCEALTEGMDLEAAFDAAYEGKNG